MLGNVLYQSGSISNCIELNQRGQHRLISFVSVVAREEPPPVSRQLFCLVQLEQVAFDILIKLVTFVHMLRRSVKGSSQKKTPRKWPKRTLSGLAAQNLNFAYLISVLLY